MGRGISGQSSKAGVDQDLDEILNNILIEPNEQLTEPPICLSIDEGDYESILGSAGDFSLVIGKAKSKKTFFISIALAAAARNGVALGKIKGCLPEGKEKVIFFDTEQSRHHVIKVYNRIAELSETDLDENFLAYPLRKFSVQKRLDLIEHALYNTPNVGLAVIDGVRDLVTGINNEEQASLVCSKLMKWTEELQIHIICVLHENKNDKNPRGHLGSEMQNKAQTVLSVTKNSAINSISTVVAENCRDAEPKPFSFQVNEDGIPVLISDSDVPKAKRKSASVNPIDIPVEQHTKVLASIFEGTKNRNYSDTWGLIKSEFQSIFEIKLGDNKAKELLVFYQEQGCISKVDSKYILVT